MLCLRYILLLWLPVFVTALHTVTVASSVSMFTTATLISKAINGSVVTIVTVITKVTNVGMAIFRRVRKIAKSDS